MLPFIYFHLWRKKTRGVGSMRFVSSWEFWREFSNRFNRFPPSPQPRVNTYKRIFLFFCFFRTRQVFLVLLFVTAWILLWTDTFEEPSSKQLSRLGNVEEISKNFKILRFLRRQKFWSALSPWEPSLKRRNFLDKLIGIPLYCYLLRLDELCRSCFWIIEAFIFRFKQFSVNRREGKFVRVAVEDVT